MIYEVQAGEVLAKTHLLSDRFFDQFLFLVKSLYPNVEPHVPWRTPFIEIIFVFSALFQSDPGC